MLRMRKSGNDFFTYLLRELQSVQFKVGLKELTPRSRYGFPLRTDTDSEAFSVYHEGEHFSAESRCDLRRFSE